MQYYLTSLPFEMVNVRNKTSYYQIIMEVLIGRHIECEQLRMAVSSKRSELIVLYGRRRVGKTFLVRSFFNDKYTFHFVGAHGKNMQSQLAYFGEALAQYSKKKRLPKIETWHEAFLQLEKYLESCKERRKIIFFDEMPWMDTQKSDFVSELEYFWANWVQNRDDIVFIACGSASTWMKEKLEDNKGGLHNRITARIYLRPFYLRECQAYLQSRGFDWDEYQIAQCYMIFGGVPYYLSLLQPELSLPQNVDSLIFHRGGLLNDEFSELYNALFKRADRYIKIVQLLATKREGFNKTEIAAATGITGGGLTKLLINLERCDFINAYSQYGNKSKQTLYRLCDFYTLFYFRFIQNNKSQDNQYWQHHFESRQVAAWQGFSFEEVCLRHLPQIKQGLGIAGIATEASSWRYVANKGTAQNGAQVDLVISRTDNLIHLCEMKFTQTKYSITKEYAQQLLERKQLFMEVNHIKRGVVITLVTPYGLKEGVGTSVVHSSLNASALFAELLFQV